MDVWGFTLKCSGPRSKIPQLCPQLCSSQTIVQFGLQRPPSDMAAQPVRIRKEINQVDEQLCS